MTMYFSMVLRLIMSKFSKIFRFKTFDFSASKLNFSYSQSFSRSAAFEQFVSTTLSKIDWKKVFKAKTSEYELIEGIKPKKDTPFSKINSLMYESTSFLGELERNVI